MKKRISLILAVIMIMAVMVPALPVISVSAEAADTWNPAEGKYEISTVADLKAFYEDASLYNNYNEQTITLKNDIVFNDTSVANWYKNPVNKVENAIADFSGTFDGNNNTITGFYNDCPLNNEWVVANGFIQVLGHFGVIKNLTLDGYYIGGDFEDSTGTKAKACGSLVGYVDANNAVITNCTLKNGTVDGNNQVAVGAVVGYMTGTKKYTMSGYSGKSTHKLEISTTHVQSSVKLINGTYVGGILGLASIEQNYSGGNLGLYAWALADSCFEGNADGVDPKPVGNIIGGGNDYSIYNVEVGDTWNNLYNALTKNNNSADYASVLKKLDRNIKYGIQGTWNPEEGCFDISTVSDLKAFYEYGYVGAEWDSNDGKYTNVTVNLMNDIVFNDTTDAEWYKNATNRITQTIYLKNSTFDGNGHTITGLCIDNTYRAWGGAGLIGFAQDVTITNLTLDGYYIKGTCTHDTDKASCYGVGSLVGFLYAGYVNASGCTLKDGVLDGNGTTGVGGVVGNVKGELTDAYVYANKSTSRVAVTDVIISNVSVSNGAYLGGIAGIWNLGKNISGGNLGAYVMVLDDSDISVTTDGKLVKPFGALNITGTGESANDGLGQRLSLLTADDGYLSAIFETPEIAEFQALAANFIYGEVSPNVSLAGYQLKGDDSIRFVGIVNDYTDLEELGFAITVGDVRKTVTVTKIYDSLVAANETVEPANGGKYFTFVITGIDETTDFKVQTYSKTELGSAVYGVESTYTFTVNS